VGGDDAKNEAGVDVSGLHMLLIIATTDLPTGKEGN
jgi:hypothetical protein